MDGPVVSPAPSPAPSLAPAGLGWDEGWAASFAPFAAPGLLPARVVAAHRGLWRVALAAGDRDATVAGRLRHDAAGPGDLPAVGDWVVASDTSPAVVSAVLPRRSALVRNREDGQVAADQVLAANVDRSLVVAGLDGDLNLRRLERFLAVAWSGGGTPVVLLNKADLASDLAAVLVAVEAVAPGVEVRTLSALSGDGVAALSRDHLQPGITAVVLGSSGVGKSTLVNALLGEERQRTSAVREDDSRGRHTTTHRELIRLPGGGLLIDTPGIRALGVAGAADGLAPAFADVEDLAAGCRFTDCLHDREPGCNVRAALADGRLAPDRLLGHRKLEREAAYAARANDVLLRDAERRRWKAISIAAQRHVQHKYGSDR